MKNGIIRFAALYVFNVAVLLLIDLVFGKVSVGFHALWASVILTLAALFVKPILTRLFTQTAARSAGSRSASAEKAVQYLLVYLVELAIWSLTVGFSGVTARGFWGYVLPPLILLAGWVVYDQIDDKLHAKAGAVYDAVESRMSAPKTTAPAPDSPATAQAREELKDGLTAEQRRMLDELG